MGIKTIESKRTRLSPSRLAGFRPKPKAYNITDLDCPGLMIHVGASGTKSWHYRFYWEKQRQILTLGQYPHLGIADAHDLARRAREAIEKGIDPRRAGIARKHDIPAPAVNGNGVASLHAVESLAADFIEKEITPNRKRPQDVRWALDKYVLSKWRGRDARSIKPREVRELLFAIADGGSRVMANRVKAMVSQMFLYAVERDVIESTPVQLLRPPGGKEKARSRALTDKELAVYLRDPVAATRYDRLSRIITLLLLTAARRGELALARVRDIDFEAKTWYVPPEHSKNGIEHLVPLSDAALAEFRELKKIADAQRSRWLLPGTDPSKHIEPKLLTRGVAKCQQRFKKLGIAAFTLHDLRRTCRTGLSRLKVQPHIAELVLNHKQTGIVATYDVHDYLDEKRDALDKWAAHLTTLSAKAK